MPFAMKVKFFKGCFVFRPWWLIIGSVLVYAVFYMDRYGAFGVIPQVFLGIIGGRLLVKAFYEKNQKALDRYLGKGKRRGSWRASK